MLKFHPELIKVQKNKEKAAAKLAELRIAEHNPKRENIFRCDAKLEEGTLFERECGAEFPIKDLAYIQPMHYNSGAYEEGWETSDHSGSLQCPFCKTIWSFNTDYDYKENKYKEENTYITLKPYFKDVVEQKR